MKHTSGLNDNDLLQQFEITYHRKLTPPREAEERTKRHIAEILERLNTSHDLLHGEDVDEWVRRKIKNLKTATGKPYTLKNLHRYKSKEIWVELYLELRRLKNSLEKKTYYIYAENPEGLDDKERKLLLVRVYDYCCEYYAKKNRSLLSTHENSDCLQSEAFDHIDFALRIFKKQEKTMKEWEKQFKAFFICHVDFYYRKTIHLDRRQSFKDGASAGLDYDYIGKLEDFYISKSKESEELVVLPSLISKIQALPQALQELAYNLYSMTPDGKDHPLKTSTLLLKLGTSTEERLVNLERLRVFIEEVAEELALEGITNRAEELKEVIYKRFPLATQSFYEATKGQKEVA